VQALVITQVTLAAHRGVGLFNLTHITQQRLGESIMNDVTSGDCSTLQIDRVTVRM